VLLLGRLRISSLHSALQGSSRKYTAYSKVTGITKDSGQSTFDIRAPGWALNRQEHISELYGTSPSIEHLKRLLADFAEERDWGSSHRPRNLMLGIITEVGELAELLQWNGDRDAKITDELRDKFTQELGDVAIFLLRMTDLHGHGAENLIPASSMGKL
jgi:NTP pyrophosphatase (non-canonical NTP hydrolase)